MSKPATTDVFRALTGKSPDDVITPLQIAIELTEWMQAISCCIEDLAAKPGNVNIERIQRLAGAARYLAEDRGNYLECVCEGLGIALQKNWGQA